MNNVQSIFNDSLSASEFSRKYLQYLSTVLEKLDEKAIGSFIELILKVREDGKTIYFIGNGGSAATASHFSNDLMIGTRSSRKPFKAISLTDNVAVLTAIGNDFGYEELFTKQLEPLLQAGDLVVAISASGNSSNIIKALELAKKRECKTIGLSGFDGGKLKEMADVSLHVQTPKGEYGPVEDIHMIFDHIIGNYLLMYCRKHD